MADENRKGHSPRHDSGRSRRNYNDDRGSRDEQPRHRSRSPRRDRERGHNYSEGRDHNRQDERNGEDGRHVRSRDNDRARPRRHDGAGFKWKQKLPDTKDGREGEQKKLERGYRRRSRSPRRDRDRHDEGNSKKSRSAGGNSVEDKFGVADKFGLSSIPSTTNSNSKDTSEPPKRAADPTTSAITGEPMIIVNVNDRLGTKASIPCLASDPIRLFKAQVAARIGRQPHEILLKRQGERPFKDQLTLEDYGVSNGVQIDLEIDTGE